METPPEVEGLSRDRWCVVTEEWRDVPGYEGLYQVSDEGRVKSLPRHGVRGGIRKLRIRQGTGRSSHPYYALDLNKDDVVTRHSVHRLVAAAFLGLSPSDLVDHINRDGLDNRLSNLRLCNGTQNNANSKRPCDNTSGFKGVTFHKKSGKWQAQIGWAGASHYLGIFETPEEAHAAYCEAATKRHGEFARAE